MASFRISPPPTEPEPLDAGVLRTSILAMLALILGSMLAYDMVRPRLTSPSAPFPRPRPSASGAAPVLATYPAQRLPSTSAPTPGNTGG
jgi:hypothetical protein